MSAERFDKPQISSDTSGRKLRSQYGSVCWRSKDGRIEVLLITSRGTGRWIIPKGWPIDGKKPHQAAAQEAFEEAGVIGEPCRNSIGLYTYDKVQDDSSSVPCAVTVFALEVQRLLDRFPEKAQRRRRWFSRRRASEAVDEPELRQILRHFDPRLLR
jgi:ADP-ribose pyrophosphatase YjhB (NUDIX family)